jgi:putative chitinase
VESGHDQQDQSHIFLRPSEPPFVGWQTPRQGASNARAVLDYWEQNSPKADDRWPAYAMGTAHHETDRTFGPIREYGRGKGKKYPPYYGRGLVQLTWDYNYKKMSPKVGVDLYKSPDLALEVRAIPIMFIGMKEGLFTGKKFADYFNPTKEDWVNARRMINGTIDSWPRQKILQRTTG